MRPKGEVTLVIPSYNAGDEIERTLGRLRAFFEQQPYGHELIVVNDGSCDRTQAALTTISSAYPELRVLVNGRNMGKGYSVKRGMLEATGRFIFYLDADLAYPIEGMESLLKPLREGTHEVAIGSRIHPGSLFHIHPRHFRYVYQRHLMSRIFNWTVRRALAIRAMDTQCGFKGFAAEAAKAIFSRVGIAGFAFDVEVLLIAQRLGLQVIEVPVTYMYNGGVSTVKILENGCQALRDLAKVYRWDQRGKYLSSRQGFSQRA
jgi:dolichyl-phosphate beta-glucosyltransferase